MAGKALFCAAKDLPESAGDICAIHTSQKRRRENGNYLLYLDEDYAYAHHPKIELARIIMARIPTLPFLLFL